MIINNRNKNEIKKNTRKEILDHIYIFWNHQQISFSIDLKRWS